MGLLAVELPGYRYLVCPWPAQVRGHSLLPVLFQVPCLDDHKMLKWLHKGLLLHVN
jgi:hypothetical protein